ncbi:hypothetical protein ACFWN2_07150 [Lentzea sp. NPDC058436]|uniref:hypothetical protein n=1 Tax=Lentzea sp. NPDC058436 TaxID=3346499 RepID=UPI0036652C86
MSEKTSRFAPGRRRLPLLVLCSSALLLTITTGIGHVARTPASSTAPNVVPASRSIAVPSLVPPSTGEPAVVPPSSAPTTQPPQATQRRQTAVTRTPEPVPGPVTTSAPGTSASPTATSSSRSSAPSTTPSSSTPAASTSGR